MEKRDWVVDAKRRPATSTQISGPRYTRFPVYRLKFASQTSCGHLQSTPARARRRASMEPAAICRHQQPLAANFGKRFPSRSSPAARNAKPATCCAFWSCPLTAANRFLMSHRTVRSPDCRTGRASGHPRSSCVPSPRSGASLQRLSRRPDPAAQRAIAPKASAATVQQAESMPMPAA